MRMLIAVLGRWDREKLAEFLIFVSGSSQVALGGFAALREAGNPVTVKRGGMKRWLPSARKRGRDGEQALDGHS
jgi:hypothetical protein